jgi:ribonuclease Z
MTFNLTVLGSGAGTPLPGRFTSAQVLNVHERFVLIDCGEGTQINMRRFGINFNRVELILISHLHGDHFFGLPGLLNTFQLLGRQKQLDIIGHAELKPFIEYVFEISGSNILFPINFHCIDVNNPYNEFDFEEYKVETFPLKHRIPVLGYKITERRKTVKIRKDFKEKYQPEIYQIHEILNGKPFFDKDGNEIPCEEILTQPPIPRSFAYVADTIFDKSIVPYIQEVDLLYHEATYSKLLQKSAAENFHSTAVEAALIAAEAKVKKLLIGHYSSRYKTPELLLSEAKQVFSNTITAEDGLLITI